VLELNTWVGSIVPRQKVDLVALDDGLELAAVMAAATGCPVAPAGDRGCPLPRRRESRGGMRC
jgi:hypothetical protein